MLEFALKEEEELVEWEVWKGPPPPPLGENWVPQGWKSRAGGQRPDEEIASMSVCVVGVKRVKRLGMRPQWHFLGSPSIENARPPILSRNLPLGVKSLVDKREQSRSGLRFLKAIIVL